MVAADRGEPLAHLGDGIATGLAQGTAESLCAGAIRPGADLSLVTARFMVWLLSDPEHGVITVAREQGRRAIDTVTGLYTRVIAGEVVTDGEWSAALVLAWSGETTANDGDSAAYQRWSDAAYEAWITGEPPVEPAPPGDAYSAARTAAVAAGYAAWTARDPGRAADAVRTAAQATGATAYARMAAKLRELLAAAPLPGRPDDPD
ncbi:MAG TPA: hypothetical protein VLL08_27135 [Kineosporiaceae bacterium]|nr:hypothetical protein [Kineosporiaceae bacterium]